MTEQKERDESEETVEGWAGKDQKVLPHWWKEIALPLMYMHMHTHVCTAGNT